MIGDGHRARSTMPNVHVSTALLAAPEWLLTSPASRGNWICLLGYCARAENGGMIAGAAAWSDLQWALVLGPTGGRTSVDALVLDGLAEWRGDALLLGGYPLDAERIYQSQRVAGQRRAAARQRGTQEIRRDQTGSDPIGSDLIRLAPTNPPTSSPGSSPTSSHDEDQLEPADDEQVEYVATPDPEHHCGAPPGCCTHNMRPVARS